MHFVEHSIQTHAFKHNQHVFWRHVRQPAHAQPWWCLCREPHNTLFDQINNNAASLSAMSVRGSTLIWYWCSAKKPVTVVLPINQSPNTTRAQRIQLNCPH